VTFSSFFVLPRDFWLLLRLPVRKSLVGSGALYCALDLRSGARFSCGHFGFSLAWVLHFRSYVGCQRRVLAGPVCPRVGSLLWFWSSLQGVFLTVIPFMHVVIFLFLGLSFGPQDLVFVHATAARTNDSILMQILIFPRVSLLLKSWFIQSDAKDFGSRIASAHVSRLASQISAPAWFFVRS
jgi:hypothetical protein